MDYFKASEFLIEDISFFDKGARYSGRGLLTWMPTNGFHVEAPVTRVQGLQQKAFRFGVSGFLPEESYHIIRMDLLNSGRAISYDVPIFEDPRLSFQSWLSLELPIVTFANSNRRPPSDKWYGTALVRTSDIILPDYIETKTLLNGRDFGTSLSAKGLVVEQEDFSIHGKAYDDEYVEIHWELPKDMWSARQHWLWAEALCDSLSIVYGIRFALVRKEVVFQDIICETLIKEAPIVRLHELAPLSFLSNLSMDKATFSQVLRQLAKNTRNSRLFKYLFFQLSEAAATNNYNVTEFLVAIQLEALLRNLLNHPFMPGDRSWSTKAGLEKFRNESLDDSWKDACERALTAYNILRHPNGHPDWALNSRWTSSKGNASLNEMRLLCSFYGQMILFLSGVKDVPHE